MKKYLSLILAFIVLFTLSACNNNESQQTTTNPTNETNSEETHPSEYIPIDTAEELINISLEKQYILTADINLEGIEWNPIGNYQTPFNGLLEGNGHKILNLKITSPHLYAGLFGYNCGTIQNITLENVFIEASSLEKNYFIYAGALVGCNDGTISNCSSSGSITSQANLTLIGGLVGYNCEGIINNCFSSAEINAQSFFTDIGESTSGGLVGTNCSTISNCFATGNISSSGADCCSGGLVGSNQGNLSKCYASGNVLAYSHISNNHSFLSATAGGLIGRDSESIVTECYATGTVKTDVFSSKPSSNSTAKSGGLIGSTYNTTINSCYALGNVEASVTSHSTGRNVYIGGLIGKDNTKNITNCFRLNTQLLSKTDGAFTKEEGTNSLGEPVESSIIQTVIFHTETLGWSNSDWIFEDGKNPILK